MGGRGIAPFGGAEEMVKDLKAAVFPDREIKMVVVKDGGSYLQTIY